MAPWCLGGNVFGWTADEATSFRLLDAFVDAGFGFIDTADVYSTWVPGHVGGESETVIGRWLKKRGNRDEVVIATKVGMMRDRGQDNLARRTSSLSVDASLKRLQTDHIDLYQAHQDDPSRPVEEPLEAYARIIQDGKVRAIGASNYSAGVRRGARRQPDIGSAALRDDAARVQPLRARTFESAMQNRSASTTESASSPTSRSPPVS